VNAISSSTINLMFSGKRIRFADQRYEPVSEDWVRNRMNPWFKDTLKKARLNKWRKDWDCDDFAGLYHALARMYYAWQNRAKAADSPAIAEIWYEQDSGTRHAINAIVVGKKCKLRFFEPQTCRFKSLSDRERKSIYFVRF